MRCLLNAEAVDHGCAGDVLVEIERVDTSLVIPRIILCDDRGDRRSAGCRILQPGERAAAIDEKRSTVGFRWRLTRIERVRATTVGHANRFP